LKGGNIEVKFHRLLLALAVAVMLTLLLALPVQADVDDMQWMGATYSQNDMFYGMDVVGYLEESEATLVAQVVNNAGDDISIESAALEFDWGGDPIDTSDYPATLDQGESGLATFTFTVPSADVASNLVTHDYTVTVEYQLEDDSGRTEWTNQFLGAGDQTTFNLPQTPVQPDSVSLYLVNAAGERRILPSDEYTVDNHWTGEITFGAAPGTATHQVRAYWQEITQIGTGDWDETEFPLPGVPGNAHAVSLSVYLQEGTDDLVSVDSADYSFDRETGVITFSTAPDNGQRVVAGWDYYRFWQGTGNDFVVYSNDQSEALALKKEIDATNLGVWIGAVPAKSRQWLAQSGEAESLGDEQYMAGNFVDAVTYYETALQSVDEAIDADKDLVKQDMTIPSIAVWLAGFGLLIFGLGVIIYAIRWKAPPAPPATG
jgi:hypothetical protein